MSNAETAPSPTSPSTARSRSVNLIVRRTIRASAERLFHAWTQPAHLEKWWGPKNVQCFGAEVDLRVGGRYRIGNRFPDGKEVWIRGEFEQITPPRELVYTWHVAEETTDSERVTVKFEPREDPGTTEVVIIHQRISDPEVRESHERGWRDCLDGLADYAVA